MSRFVSARKFHIAIFTGIAVFVMLLTPSRLPAPERRGGGPAPKPAPKAGPPGPRADRPVGPKVAKPLPPGVRKPLPPGAYVRQPHYWLPYYKPGYPARIGTAIGYPYYVGGTSYVVAAPTGAAGETESAQPPPTTESAGATDERYQQLLELTDLIHDWRAMNESSTLHDRLPGDDAPDGARRFVSRIRKANERFDAASRSALWALSNGQPAADKVQETRDAWKEIVALVDTLPESKKSDG